MITKDPRFIAAYRVFANTGMGVIMRTTMQLDMAGFENAPRTGPLIIVINHNSFLDPLVPIVFVRNDVYPLSKVEALDHWLGFFVRWYDAIPVRRGDADASTFKRALRVLRAGHATLIAPE